VRACPTGGSASMTDMPALAGAAHTVTGRAPIRECSCRRDRCAPVSAGRVTRGSAGGVLRAGRELTATLSDSAPTGSRAACPFVRRAPLLAAVATDPQVRQRQRPGLLSRHGGDSTGDERRDARSRTGRPTDGLRRRLKGRRSDFRRADRPSGRRARRPRYLTSRCAVDPDLTEPSQYRYRLSEREPASRWVASGCAGRGVAGLRGCPGLSGSATWWWSVT
jgi:hypothetical protein